MRSVFEVEESKLIKLGEDPAKAKLCLGIFSLNELPNVVEESKIRVDDLTEMVNWSLSNADHHESFDVLHVDLIQLKHLRPEHHKVIIYKDENRLYFFAEDKIADEFIEFYAEERHVKYSLDRLLFLFFKKITWQYTQTLNQLEEKVNKMEDKLLLSKDHNYLKQIMLIRKTLMYYNNNFETMHDLIEDVLLDENSLLSGDGGKEYSSIMRKFDRLSSRALVIKDLVSQVRETYQAQEDLKLNKTMNVITVMTSVFLPLTLITSWYGMNLKMPEFNLDYGYPLVISLCIVVALATALFFKKNKWF